ncbi:MAG: hypothetical protein Fur0028_15800 [Bacteroidales bacterium]
MRHADAQKALRKGLFVSGQATKDLADTKQLNKNEIYKRRNN